MEHSNAKIDKKALEQSLQNVLDKKGSLKKHISLNNLLELKKALYPVNNYITVKLTKKFADTLPKIFKNTKKLPKEIKNIDKKKIREILDGNANANGYDFVYPHITAEVKANIPYQFVKYGSSQKSGLEKDIRGLRNPATKSKRNHNPKKDYKFLVVLDYKRKGYNTQEAIDDLISPKDIFKYVEVVDLKKPPQLDTKKIYIVMLAI